jgi:hypothetical protein
MKVRIAILIFYLLFTSIAYSQKPFSYAGKTFVNDKLDQINFLNDTVLITSFRAFPEKYSFLNDTVVLTLLHQHSDMEFEHSYKLLKHSSDTLTFVYTSLYSKPDTMQFVNLQNRILPITEFDSLRVDSYGWTGLGRLIIRSDKTVKYAKGSWIEPTEMEVKYKTFKLTDQQYQEFIKTLSESLVFMLPAERNDDGDDVTYVDITIRANKQTIVSKGADLSKIHGKLTKYLFYTVAKAN